MTRKPLVAPDKANSTSVPGDNKGTRLAMRFFTVAAVVALVGYADGSILPGASADVSGTGASQTAPIGTDGSAATLLPTATPIKHLVVIFQENESFDHYFGTYPKAANPPAEPVFTAQRNTPQVNGLTPDLLTNNPNSIQPFRLDRSQALTCSQVHNYMPEQEAYDGGAMDKFVQYTEGTATKPNQYCPKGIVMGYYDGNTVTALWNYAQHFAMSDNAFGTFYGPSTPGALNLIAGTTAGAVGGPSTSVYNAPPRAIPILRVHRQPPPSTS